MEKRLTKEEFLKDLWHPNTEEPDKSKSDIITLGFDNDAYLQFKESILWKEESWRHSISRCQIIKWAYLSDILPKQEGGEQRKHLSLMLCSTEDSSVLSNTSTVHSSRLTLRS